jgi:hypothetical protein
MRRYLIHAQECEGPFYMGTWLYCDPVLPDGARHSKRAIDGGGSVWIRYTDQTRRVVALAAHHGVRLPLLAGAFPMDQAGQNVPAAFAAAFPHGVLVWGETAARWEIEDSEVNHNAGLLVGWPYGEENADADD